MTVVDLAWGKHRRKAQDASVPSGQGPAPPPEHGTLDPSDRETITAAIAEEVAAACGATAEVCEGPVPVVGFGEHTYRFRVCTERSPWTAPHLARCADSATLGREADWTAAVRTAGFPAHGPERYRPGADVLLLIEPSGRSLLQCMLDDMASVGELLGHLGKLHARLHEVAIDAFDALEPPALRPSGQEDPERAALSEELDWLARHRPSSARTVVCHGDLHPAHVFVDLDDPSQVTVSNWTASRLAEPEVDVAITSAAFWFAPFYLDSALYRKALETARDSLVARYLDAYQEEVGAPLDRARLRYWEAARTLWLAAELSRYATNGAKGPWDPMQGVVKPERTVGQLRRRFWELAG